MKKVIVFLSLSFFASSAFAQSFNVESAAGMIKKKKFVKAKEFIDLAYENPQTANDARMWLNRGKTYIGLWNDTTVKRSDYPNAIEIAGTSLIKSLEVEPSGRWAEEARFELLNAGVPAFNVGVDAYSKADYPRAMKYLEMILKMIPFDTQGNLKRNNVSESMVNQYIGYTALEMKNYDLAVKSFDKLIAEAYNDPNIYLSMSKVYTEKGDTTKALEYIATGRKQFEDNRSLVNEEIRLYLASGKTELLITKFKEALELDPYNITYNYFLAVLYEQSGKYDEAIKGYQKTVEVDPNYYDAHTGLAALYFNKGADTDKKVKQMDLKEYSKNGERMEKEAKDNFEKALESFKKAYDINPKDMALLKSMKTLYVALRKMDDANRMDKEMKDLVAEGKQ